MVIGKLTYDENKEEGKVKINWETMPGNVVGLDILSDWIADLTKIYIRELNHVFTSKKSTGE